MNKKKKFGQILIKNGVITKEQLNIAFKKQKELGYKLGETLVEIGFVDSDDILPILSNHLKVDYKKIQKNDINMELLNILPEDIMRRYKVFPIEKQKGKIILAMADPGDLFKIDEIQIRTKLIVKPVFALRKNIEQILEIAFSKVNTNNNKNEMYNILEDLYKFEDEDFEFVEQNKTFETDVESGSAPIVKAVNAIISEAVALGSSDIHIEPYENEIRIRFRIDGVLQEIRKLPKKVEKPIVSRIKIISELDIAEKRMPQDGRFKIKQKDKNIDFRVATIPLIQGEKVVMRILDKSNLKVQLEELGFENHELKKLRELLKSSYGMILVTGPTGSGKTTTLYSALNTINNSKINISTVEDPVEFQIDGINQLQCLNSKQLNFASALRAFLRQDPDVLMVGEIRDYETAEVAIKSALTGHLLLSTLHTNDAVSTIQRLKNIGIESYMIGTSLLMVIAQRLGRKVCNSCKEETKLTKGEAAVLGINYDENKDKTFYKGKGCKKCNNTGYRGRIGFYELLVIDEELRELISRNSENDVIKKVAIKKGMTTIKEAGLKKAEQGITSIEEIIRVC